MTKDFITLEYLNIHVMNKLSLLNNKLKCTNESIEWLVSHPFLTIPTRNTWGKATCIVSTLTEGDNSQNVLYCPPTKLFC